VLAIGFLTWSARYFLATRWYVFPALYLNFSYLAERFVFVQDGSYLVMLTVLAGALAAARRGREGSHLLVALATTMKLSPLFYVVNLTRMRRVTAVAYLAILVAGFVLPYVVWENYLYIFRYNDELKGSVTSSLLALAVAAVVGALVWTVDRRGRLDAEDRIGWALVPVAMFLAFKMNAARHLIMALIVPDKRGVRNVAVAFGLALHTIAPDLVALNAVAPIASLILVAALVSMLTKS
jgi:hypothetical protein